MKKAIVEGYEFMMNEMNITNDYFTATTLRGPIAMSGYSTVEIRLTAQMPEADIRELFGAVKDRHMLIVVKR